MKLSLLRRCKRLTILDNTSVLRKTPTGREWAAVCMSVYWVGHSAGQITIVHGLYWLFTKVSFQVFTPERQPKHAVRHAFYWNTCIYIKLPIGICDSDSNLWGEGFNKHCLKLISYYAIINLSNLFHEWLFIIFMCIHVINLIKIRNWKL
jgi:hypothetical protein